MRLSSVISIESLAAMLSSFEQTMPSVREPRFRRPRGRQRVKLANREKKKAARKRQRRARSITRRNRK